MSAFKYFSKTECLHVHVRTTADFSMSVNGTTGNEDAKLNVFKAYTVVYFQISLRCESHEHVKRLAVSHRSFK